MAGVALCAFDRPDGPLTLLRHLRSSRSIFAAGKNMRLLEKPTGPDAGGRVCDETNNGNLVASGLRPRRRVLRTSRRRPSSSELRSSKAPIELGLSSEWLRTGLILGSGAVSRELSPQLGGDARVRVGDVVDAIASR